MRLNRMPLPNIINTNKPKNLQFAICHLQFAISPYTLPRAPESTAGRAVQQSCVAQAVSKPGWSKSRSDSAWLD